MAGQTARGHQRSPTDDCFGDVLPLVQSDMPELGSPGKAFIGFRQNRYQRNPDLMSTRGIRLFAAELGCRFDGALVAEIYR